MCVSCGRVWLLLAAASLSVARADDRTSRLEFFEKRIRPILVDHCYDCHGPDESSGSLRLDSQAGWQRGGQSGPAIVPGDPVSSPLVRAVEYRNPELQMPPEEAGGRLTDRQIADLVHWVRSGAVDPRTGDDVVSEIDDASRRHWAFQPLDPPQVPAGQHPVDALINQMLSEHRFEPTVEADMRTLVRRAVYDLHGLPPTEEQLQTEQDAFPELIEQLLASPRYGERWGRHWLDVARYSDAKDGVLMYGDARIRPFAYTYRDYVIRAFNDDKPFDQFIREQIAADQLGLPEHSADLAAMGLLTLGRMFDSNRHDVIDDQIDVVTRGFLGLTVSCARCHDHKFDPIPTADYYSLYGVFASGLEPYERPRIAKVDDAGQDFEEEFAAKLQEVETTQESHYQFTLRTACERTPDYLVKVVTSEPDIDETSIFFLSLIPEQLRPRITWRWRQLIARRAFADDRVFGPWHDLMQDPVLRPEVWRERGVDSRIIDGLVQAAPQTPEEIARTYGEIIRSVWRRKDQLRQQIAKLESQLATMDGSPLNLADMVAGGNGFGTGTRGHGIHPGSGEPTDDQTGFVEIERPGEAIPVPSSEFIDAVFVPNDTAATATTTGIRIDGLVASSGKTWDYCKYGPSSGFTSTKIDGVDYASAPNWMLGMHANKGITFDIQAMRSRYAFGDSRFQTVLGHGGASGESQLNYGVYLDGRAVFEHTGFQAQQPGIAVDVEIPQTARYLTLVVTEGAQGISHDQAMLGNPRIVPAATEPSQNPQAERLVELRRRRDELQQQMDALNLAQDPLGSLLVGRSSPVWFPPEDIYHYLSRQKKDAFRGLVNQLDAIAVKHSDAASRAMVLVDGAVPYEPVIFQRGDPGQRGAPVPRQFLQVLSPESREPFPDGSGRRNLAEAIASPDNPLTARVWVNRVWMHHFGQSLLENPDDFGLRTAAPVHQPLLDWLAADFVRHGWSTRRLHRLIMSSAAWQRASEIPATERMQEQLQRDPDNQWLWHARRRRLDFEQMRDTLLAVSGQLSDVMYGRPPLITDPANTRRTVYAFVERQNIPSMVQTFDFANADTSTARRVTTTVPQQALFAMNSEFMDRAAESLGGRVASLSGEDQIRGLYRAVYGRLPEDDELQLGTEFLKSNTVEHLAQVLLMSNELMFID